MHNQKIRASKETLCYAGFSCYKIFYIAGPFITQPFVTLFYTPSCIFIYFFFVLIFIFSFIFAFVSHSLTMSYLGSPTSISYLVAILISCFRSCDLISYSVAILVFYLMTTLVFCLMAAFVSHSRFSVFVSCFMAVLIFCFGSSASISHPGFLVHFSPSILDLGFSPLRKFKQSLSKEP